MQRITMVAIALLAAGAVTSAQQTNPVQRNEPGSPSGSQWLKDENVLRPARQRMLHSRLLEFHAN